MLPAASPSWTPSCASVVAPAPCSDDAASSVSLSSWPPGMPSPYSPWPPAASEALAIAAMPKPPAGGPSRAAWPPPGSGCARTPRPLSAVASAALGGGAGVADVPPWPVPPPPAPSGTDEPVRMASASIRPCCSAENPRFRYTAGSRLTCGLPAGGSGASADAMAVTYTSASPRALAGTFGCARGPESGGAARTCVDGIGGWLMWPYGCGGGRLSSAAAAWLRRTRCSASSTWASGTVPRPRRAEAADEEDDDGGGSHVVGWRAARAFGVASGGRASFRFRSAACERPGRAAAPSAALRAPPTSPVGGDLSRFGGDLSRFGGDFSRFGGERSPGRVWWRDGPLVGVLAKLLKLLTADGLGCTIERRPDRDLFSSRRMYAKEGRGRTHKQRGVRSGGRTARG